MTSIQKAGSDSDKTELTTEGEYSSVRDGFKISYEDSDATGFNGSVTEITVTGNMASIMRSGTAQSNLVVEKDKKHYCHYNTPFGEMMVGIFTKEIKNELTENGGTLSLKYTVDVNASYVSDNEIFLDVRKI